MSQALYRRYRPDTFAEVIGQEHVTDPLTAALAKDRVNHAYLFSGPRGCGKTTSARILARCLNCAQGPTATPCGECPSCQDLARGGPGSLDVVEIDAASHGGVDDARSLRERAVFAPARDRFKVFIIDEAHMVSTQGFNALLKIVEEPPPHVRFVFATTEPEKVIGTIRSRTHHYPFRLVPPERLGSYLAEICGREGVEVGQGVLPLVVRAGAGSVRDSLSVLDQLIAGAGPDGLTYRLAVALLGYTDAALLDEVVDALAAGDGATVFGVVDRVIESGHDPRRFVEDVLERLRDLVLVAAMPDGGHAVLRGLPADQLDRMRGQAGRFGRAELSRAADVVNAALTEMTGATSPRLQLELLCARLLLPGSDDGERGLRARVDRLERRVGVAGPGSGPVETERAESRQPPSSRPAESRPADSRPADSRRAESRSAEPRRAESRSAEPRRAESRSAEPRRAESRRAESRPAEPEPGPAPARPLDEGSAQPRQAEPAETAVTPAGPEPGGWDSGAGALDSAAIRRRWPEVLTRLSGLRRTTWSLISPHAQVLDYDGERLLLGFSSPGLVGSFTRGPHQEYLRQALIDSIGLDCRIEPVAGDRPPDRSGPTPSGSPPRSDAGPVGAPRPGSARPDPSARANAAPQSEPAPARSGSSRAARSGPSGSSGRAATGPQRGPAGSPFDDVPPPDEPLPDDEPPFEPGPPPDAAAAGARRPRTRPATGRRPPAPPPKPEDDEPSADDPDIEGSGMVGAPVIEQLLGGRIIEERPE